NAVIDQLNSLASPNSTQTTGGGGLLLGDSLINQIGAALGSIVGSSVSNDGLKGTLASIGITFQSDTGGQPFAELQIHADPNGPKLEGTVQDNLAQIASLFNSTDGIALQLDSVIAGYTSNEGTIAIRTNTLIADIKSLSDQQDDLKTYAAQLTSSFS